MDVGVAEVEGHLRRGEREDHAAVRGVHVVEDAEPAAVGRPPGQHVGDGVHRVDQAGVVVPGGRDDDDTGAGPRLGARREGVQLGLHRRGLQQPGGARGAQPQLQVEDLGGLGDGVVGERGGEDDHPPGARRAQGVAADAQGGEGALVGAAGEVAVGGVGVQQAGEGQDGLAFQPAGAADAVAEPGVDADVVGVALGEAPERVQGQAVRRGHGEAQPHRVLGRVPARHLGEPRLQHRAQLVAGQGCLGKGVGLGRTVLQIRHVSPPPGAGRTAGRPAGPRPGPGRRCARPPRRAAP